MTKSQADSLLHVAEGLRKDILLSCPELKGSLSKDFDRLALYCRARGLAFFTLDLPHLDSLLIRGLEVGRLCLEGPLSHAVSKRVRVPRLFSGLWLRVFDKDSSIKQDVDVNAILFLRQLCCLGKKIAVECSYDRTQATVRAYHDIERGLRAPSLDWSSDRLDGESDCSLLHLGEGCDSACEVNTLFVQEEATTSGCHSCASESDHQGLVRLLDQVQQVADLVSTSLGLYDPFWYSFQKGQDNKGIGFMHGPGAVAERLKPHEKSCFLNWPQKLQTVFPYEWFGVASPLQTERPLNHESPSRLLVVPKTAKRPRLIASEPASHMWCQQSVRKFLVDRLRGSFVNHFVDFHDQRKSGDLVLQASLDRKLATVDLSDASDRLTCWTVERVFRSNYSVLRALHAARTRYLRDDISKVPSFLKPKKFASQGTAVTFPVQSIVFFCIAMGVTLDGEVSIDAMLRYRNQVRVFGDDIIIPRHGYERLLRVMDALQLKVNKEKSFVNGHFRESCGVDGYLGYDVTPVKPLTVVANSPASCQAVIDNSNNLFNKGLWYASDSMRSCVPTRIQRAIRIVGYRDAGYSGFTSYVGSKESHLNSRWNPRLHRTEVRTWQLSVKSTKKPREGYSPLLDFFASIHSYEQARTVSQYGDTRKTRGGLHWEPLSHHAQRDFDESLHRTGRSRNASSGRQRITNPRSRDRTSGGCNDHRKCA